MIDKMNERVSLNLLKNSKLGRLCCVLENLEPYVVPVNYLFTADSIYMHSLPGLKISAMRLNPKICLQIDRISDGGFKWQSVIASGEFEEITEIDERVEILEKFFKEFPRFTPVEANLTKGNSLEELIVFRIKDISLTGASENWLS